MFYLFKNRRFKKQMEFEDQFIVMMYKLITNIELQMEKNDYSNMCCTGYVPGRMNEWLLLCRRFIDLINKIKKDKKSK